MTIIPTTLDFAVDKIGNSERKWGFRIGCLAFIIGLVIVGAVLIKNGGNPLSFAKLGTYWSEGIPYPDGTNGYDGQYFYQIAVHGMKASPYLDVPSFRYLRILYPFLARTLSFGSPLIIPWMLITINLLSLALGSGLIASMLYRQKKNPLYALVFTIWIGNILSIALDLSEPLALSLALLGVYYFRNEQIHAAVLVIVLSVLTREIGLVFAGTLAFYSFYSTKNIFRSLYVFVVPFFAWGSWYLYLLRIIGAHPISYYNAALTAPFWGLVRLVQQQDQIFIGYIVFISSLVLFVICLWEIFRSHKFTMFNALCLGMVIYMSVLPYETWREPIALLRLSSPLIATALLFLANTYPRLLRILVAVWTPISLIFINLLPSI